MKLFLLSFIFSVTIDAYKVPNKSKINMQNRFAAIGVSKNPKIAAKKGKSLDILPTFDFIELYTVEPISLVNAKGVVLDGFAGGIGKVLAMVGSICVACCTDDGDGILEEFM